ncbi:MAG: UDP-3-O-(3-hydroxymyristoyl)glucosamine N-acyltransferase [Campylobacterales bacterium]|nr:UDP-3-O-(3-hydroxymyristoyl)glucosamine N-acyltransferase [Campylobacterales bacterium]
MGLKFIANFLNIEANCEDCEIAKLTTLKLATHEDVSFFDNEKYLNDLKTTQAKAVLLKEEFVKFLPNGVIALISKEPYLKMAELSQLFKSSLISSDIKEPIIGNNCTILPNVYIGSGSKIGENVTILAGSFIGENVTIGSNTIIYPNVSIYNNCVIGSNVILHAGVVVGSDGFGYAHTKDGKHIKIEHLGNVEIEDDVEIGSNSTIDRAVFGVTIIKKGTKIDNLVHVAHNCEIGEYSIIVAQSGLSGSTKLGRNVIMGGQSATAGHLSIGDFATIAARGGVTKSIEGKKTYSGFPLMEHRKWLKLQAKLSKFSQE